MKRKAIIWLYILTCLFCLSGCVSETKDSAETTATSVADVSINESAKQEESETTEVVSNDVTLSLEGRGIENRGNSSINGTLEVHYIDVGQGDSILIRQGEEAMLVDAGNNSKGSLVWSYLLSQNISSLSYVIGTHPDADHIGGLDVIIYKFDCTHVFMPQKTSDTQTFDEVIQTLKTKSQTYETPKQGDTYKLGDATFQILTNTDKEYGEDTNNYSLAIRVTYGNNSFIFTGDAEIEAEADMLGSGLELRSDVYKAAHHGADTANSIAFLQAVNPTYCVISCGMDNSYGHPRAEFLNNLRSMGVSVFRTDEQGTIVATSDGENITFNCSPSTTWKAGEPTRNSEIQVEADESKEERNNTEKSTYILNTNTKKFHRASCSSVKKMADKNKRTTDKSREELIANGYEPCKNCNP